MAVLKSMELDSKLADMQGWNYKEKQIGKLFELSNFKEALNFVNKVGEASEEMNHHPDIFIHSWNKVRAISSQCSPPVSGIWRRGSSSRFSNA